MTKDLLRVDEVAEMFRVSESTVRRWASEGKIKSIHTPGGCLRLISDDVDKILKNPKICERDKRDDISCT